MAYVQVRWPGLVYKEERVIDRGIENRCSISIFDPAGSLHFRNGDGIENKFGPDVELERIRARLRCGPCGGRNALLYRIWEGAGEFKYGDG